MQTTEDEFEKSLELMRMDDDGWGSAIGSQWTSKPDEPGDAKMDDEPPVEPDYIVE
jgi:hypothetical protein